MSFIGPAAGERDKLSSLQRSEELNVSSKDCLSSILGPTQLQHHCKYQIGHQRCDFQKSVRAWHSALLKKIIP